MPISLLILTCVVLAVEDGAGTDLASKLLAGGPVICGLGIQLNIILIKAQFRKPFQKLAALSKAQYSVEICVITYKHLELW